jgi:alkylated DNA repair protein alkB homolog 6
MQKLGLWANAPHSAPNHILVNEYTPGQGIMAHTDGPAYYGLVATVSLGGAIVLDLEARGEGEKGRVYRILQERRSLLVTTQALYGEYMHGIAERAVDEDLGPGSVANWGLLGDPKAFEDGINERETRISLTYRDVLKVSKVGEKLMGAMFGKRQ